MHVRSRGSVWKQPSTQSQHECITHRIDEDIRWEHVESFPSQCQAPQTLTQQCEPRPSGCENAIPRGEVEEDDSGGFDADIESIPRIFQNLLFAGIVVSRVDYAEGARVFLLGREDGLEEHAFAAAAGVAKGVEEADDAGVFFGKCGFIRGGFDAFPVFEGGGGGGGGSGDGGVRFLFVVDGAGGEDFAAMGCFTEDRGADGAAEEAEEGGTKEGGKEYGTQEEGEHGEDHGEEHGEGGECKNHEQRLDKGVLTVHLKGCDVNLVSISLVHVTLNFFHVELGG